MPPPLKSWADLSPSGRRARRRRLRAAHGVDATAPLPVDPAFVRKLVKLKFVEPEATSDPDQLGLALREFIDRVADVSERLNESGKTSLTP